MQDHKLAMCVYGLQREAGPSSREAGSLMVNHGEGGSAIVEEYALSADALRMLVYRAERELRITGKTLEEFCGEDPPAFIIMDRIDTNTKHISV